ncbi:DUF992 domain-containing protein [Metarhizobium album]|uniref:DUF992 domain-containing protein n=1 Tax=Metarhizobium album TaxID=2182425 RepID=A0A2U2DLL1_9HYPH|nr:DUF992 domain-containing protein [Rhizobium album]PWE54188.1 DUF992 domain-containing protein [Rhizobium album]
MKKTLALSMLAASLSLAGGTIAYAADMTAAPTYETPPGERDGVKIGYLDCSIGGGVGYVLGSAKGMECAFKPARNSEPLDHYSGVVRKLGVDLGFTTRSRLIWAVFAPTAGYHQGSLAGLYEGATAEATVGAGIGANVLIGGTSGSIHLQTISVTGQLGLNVAAGGASMTLTPVD